MNEKTMVTGLGILSAYGPGIRAAVEGIKAGVCPRRPAAGIGYPSDTPPLASAFLPRPLPPGEAATAIHLTETIDQLLAQWNGDPEALRDEETALIVGTGGFLFASGAELYWRSKQTAPMDEPFYVRGPAWGSSLIARHLGMRATPLTLSTGCSSSANALLAATQMLQRGRAKRVLVVGAEGLSAVTLSGFDSLLLLDPEGCRPFDRDRAGLQIGEGFAAIMLESGRKGQASILGGANLCDTHHLTSASPGGDVMRDVMRQALANAAVGPGAVTAVKAHGTGSADSDRAEANALHAVFGAALPPVIGLKRYVGHTLGACGAVETAALIGCLQNGFLPATAGFRAMDPELGIVPTQPAQVGGAGIYLLNFFGFGGNYTSLVMEFP
ncbi:MAG: beta-ketoacyl-[acyl-carrier-protein] synthase family protein [Burkholderiales bacterium]